MSAWWWLVWPIVTVVLGLACAFESAQRNIEVDTSILWLIALWPLVLMVLISASPFALAGYLGRKARRIKP